MKFVSILMCSMAVGLFLTGCSQHDEVGVDAASANLETVPEISAPLTPTKEVLVFRAKYYQTTGPCIQLDDDALGMPIIDAFDVVELLEGDLRAKTIHVRAMTEHGLSYPKEMAEGEIYTFRLTPRSETSKRLRENQHQEGYTFLWIDGDEIEFQQPIN